MAAAQQTWIMPALLVQPIIILSRAQVCRRGCRRGAAEERPVACHATMPAALATGYLLEYN